MTYNTIFFFGHHRCGTTWISDICEDVCRESWLKYYKAHSPAKFNFDLKQFITANKIDFLSYTNADWNYLSGIENYRGFHVTRDPRDIIVSSYFSHLHSHSTREWKELIDHRKKLENTSREEGLYL